MKRTLLILAMVIFCFGFARATDYYVDGKNGSNTSGDGAQDKPWKSITYALSRVTTGAEMNTIHVAAAVYDTTLETFPIMMKNKISLLGAGRDSTILDAKQTETAIWCVNVIDARTRIEGFTITGGQVNKTKSSRGWQGSGILIETSSLSVINNKITDNGGFLDPSIMCDRSSPTIQGNLIVNNEDYGIQTVDNISSPIICNNTIENHIEAGIQCSWSSSPLIQGNLICSNADGIGCELGATPIIEANEISNNHTGIRSEYSSTRIERNIIAHNTEDGIFVWSFGPEYPPGPIVVNNTIDSNDAEGIEVNSLYGDVEVSLVKNNIISNNSGYGMKETGGSNRAEMTSVPFNLFYNNTVGHYLYKGTQVFTSVALMDSLLQECRWNLEGDPMFVDAANGDYHLLPGSPAVNAGDPNSPQDGDGSRADIGALPLFDWSGPPNTPQNLRAVSGHAQVSLSWSPNPDEDLAYYTIYRSLTSGFVPSRNDSIAKVNAPDTTYIDKGLRNGITYYYRICAVDLTGKKSDFTAQVSATPTFNPNFLIVTSPTHGAFVNKTPVLVKGIAVTPHVKKVEINGIQVPIVNDSFETSVNLNEGVNEIRVVGYDSLNIVAKEIKLTVKLDATPPLVKITTPGSGQSFSYSPIKVQGTVAENNLVSIDVNGVKAKRTSGSFVLGENEGEGLEIEEGWCWIKATARDSADNVGADSVQVRGDPPSSKRLYLKNDNLSWFPFAPYPPNTTMGYSTSFIIDQQTWRFPLTSDINGSTYSFSFLAGCYGSGSARMKAELILRHNNTDLILASTSEFTGNMAGSTPFGYIPPSRKDFTIAGLDPSSIMGDTLMLKISKVGGDRLGLIFIHELNMGHSWIKIPEIITNVEEHPLRTVLPLVYQLSQNYPNPFNPETVIQYQLPQQADVRLEIYNIVGELVTTLVDEKQPAGYYMARWNGKDERSRHVSSGVYLYRLTASEFVQVRKMILVR